MSKNLNYLDFQKKVFPYDSPFDRKQFGLTTNLIKFIALRFSYFFYRLGFSANALDTIGCILLIPSFVLIFQALMQKDILQFVLGFSIIAFVIFIDFIDGPLSKSSSYEYRVGDNMDNLCPDIVLMGGLAIIGLMTGNLYMTSLCWINAIFFLTYKSSTINSIPENKKWLLILLNSRFSILSVRGFIAGIFPILCLMYIYNQFIGQLLSVIVVLVNAVLSGFWLLATWEDKIKK